MRKSLPLTLLLLLLQQANGAEPYVVLGLPSPEATEMAINLAYSNLTRRVSSGIRSPGGQDWTPYEVQTAYEALSGTGMQGEALELVDYAKLIERPTTDDEIRRFSEFQVGGSAHVRAVFVVDEKDERYWPVFSMAMRLYGRARIAQVWSGDLKEAASRASSFTASLKVRRFPATVLYDPVSRASRIKYGLDGVIGEAERLLTGQLSAADRISRIQEMTSEAYTGRCKPDVPNCAWSLLLITGESVERRRDDLLQGLKHFVDACRMVQAAPTPGSQGAPCFWVRLGRSPEWKDALQARGVDAGVDFAMGALRQDPLSLAAEAAPQDGMHSRQLFTWFQSALQDGSGASALTSLPALPYTLLPEEEPNEPFTDRLLRKLYALVDLVPHLAADPKSIQPVFQALDGESQIMAASVGILAALLLLPLLKYTCCRRRSPGTEDDALTGVEMLINVSLKRKKGDPLGIRIDTCPRGGFSVGSLDAGVISRWNETQPQKELQIRTGDRIVSVSTTSGGRTISSNLEHTISNVLKLEEEFCIGVALCRKPQEVRQLVSWVSLEGLVPKSIAEFSAPRSSYGGALDDFASEVTKVGPELEAWNSARRREGACCTQTIEVGDRIISVNGLTDVRKHLDLKSPTLMVVKFRLAGAVQSRTVEVNIERTSKEDKLGLSIRPHPGAQEMDVLEIAGGAAVDRWNQNNPGRGVLRGDRLTQVNDKQTVDTMKGELATPNLALKFERWGTDARTGPVVQPPISPTPPPLSKDASVATPPVCSAATTASPSGAAPNSRSGSAFSVSGLLLVILLCGAAAASILVPSGMIAGTITKSIPSQSRRDASLGILAVGALIGLRFLWYEVAMLQKPDQRALAPQLLTAFIASCFLGCGHMLLLSWAGALA